MKLDRADRIILDCLQRDNSLSIAKLAERCHMSEPSVQRRLKRLKEQKVIKRSVSILDPQKIGSTVTLIVSIEMKTENSHCIRDFKNKLAKEDAVQQIYYVTGDVDFILIIVLPTMQSYDEFSQRLFIDDDNVKRFYTSVAMGESKVSMQIPIDNM